MSGCARISWRQTSDASAKVGPGREVLEARFSRKTVLAAIDVISVQRSFTHAALSALVIDLGQEVFAAVRSDVDASLAKRCNDLKTFVDANPEYEVEGVLSARCLGQTFLKNGMTRSRIGEVASDDHRSIRCTICLRRESPQQISTSRSSTLATIRALRRPPDVRLGTVVLRNS
jgi:hypothetical protein